MNWEKIKQNSSILMIVIVFSKIIGMLRDVVLANYFGTSNVSDAYLIASSVPVLLFYFIGHSLSTVYIPMYNKVKFEKSQEKAMDFSNSILNLSLIISTMIVLILLMFPNIVVKIFATGFDQETAKIAVKLIKISSPSIYLMCIIYICSGYLQINKNFLIPAAISLPRNIIIIFSVILANFIGIGILGWGLLSSYLLEFMLLLPFILKEKFNYRLKLELKDENLKESFYMIVPILLGMCVSQINKIVDRSIASTVITGGISALSYASIINNAIQEILVTGVITILFSNCSQLVAQKKYDLVLQKLSSTIKTISFLLIPASIGVIILAEPIIELILSRGNFDKNSILMTSGALRGYTIGLFFLALRDTFVKIFYAYKETKITTVTSILAIILNIILNIILSKYMGVNGLALATSFSAVFHCSVLLILLRKKIGNFDIRNNFILILKSLISSFIMGISVKNIYGFLILSDYSNFFSLVITIMVGIGIYFGFAFILKCDPVIKFLKRGNYAK